MKDLSQKGYSHEEVFNVLRMVSGSRNIRFRYDLLNRNHRKIRELNTVEHGSVKMAAFSSVKRTAKFEMKGEGYEVEGYMTWKDLGSTEWSEL